LARRSSASNLVANDTNDASDVFLRNLQAGVTSLISVNLTGNDSGDFASTAPVFSPDSQSVAFLSLLDASGRPIDGDHNGVPGGDAVAILSKKGIAVQGAPAGPIVAATAAFRKKAAPAPTDRRR
jgi:Tol biopolymer transport system component